MICIQVRPEQGNQLTFPQTTDQFQVEHGEDISDVGGVQVGFQVFRQERFHLHFLHLGGNAVVGRIPGDQTLFHCSLEGTVESELDADQALEEMAQLEHAGTTFQNKQRQDIRVRYVAPVAISAALVMVMAAIIAVMFWAFSLDAQDAPPLPLLLVLAAIPLLVIVGVLLALFQRIREIGKGEADDARQY